MESKSISQKDLKTIQFVIIVAVSLLAVLGMVNHFIYVSQRGNDQLIENNILQLTEDISDYKSEHDRLPSSLSDIESKDDGVNRLIKSGLLTYDTNYYGEYTYDMYSNKKYRYQLCANFDYEKKSRYSADYDDNDNEDNYYYSPSSDHPKGNYCYKLRAY